MRRDEGCVPSSRMDRIAGQLSSTIGPLRRRLLRLTREAAGLPEIPDASIELMRVVDQLGTPTVAEAAAALNTAGSTVSNLLRALLRDGLATRTTGESDRRVSHIGLTARARELLQRYDGASERIVATAMSRMHDAQRSDLEQATPALRALLGALLQTYLPASPLRRQGPGVVTALSAGQLSASR